MSATREVVDLTDGPEVAIEHIDAVDVDTGRFEVETVHGDRRWHVDISGAAASRSFVPGRATSLLTATTQSGCTN